MERGRLSRYLVDLRKGNVTEPEDEMQLMRDLVEQYSNFPYNMNPQEAHVNLDEPVTTDRAHFSEDEGENIVSRSFLSVQTASSLVNYFPCLPVSLLSNLLLDILLMRIHLTPITDPYRCHRLSRCPYSSSPPLLPFCHFLLPQNLKHNLLRPRRILARRPRACQQIPYCKGKAWTTLI